MTKIASAAWMRIGDRVQMAMGDDARNWGRPGVADGTQGTCIGFTRFQKFVPRTGNFGDPPGVYMCNGGSVVRWDDGTSDTPNAYDLTWVDDNEWHADYRPKDLEWNSAFALNQRVSDLPELPFWELDLVTDRTGRVVMPDSPMLRVTSIDYHLIGKLDDDGNQVPFFNVGAAIGETSSRWIRTEDLELVRRGPLYTWYNERDKLVWPSLRDEAEFHHYIGLYDQVRNPRSNDYTWTKDQILPGLELGLIDAVRAIPGMFGAPNAPTILGKRFHDRDLGERVRLKSIQGFSIGNGEASK